MSASPTHHDGLAEVNGARLRYRMTGTAGHLPVLVFENGWGASFECWAWLEAHLSAHARLLFYNRGGIGGSQCFAPQTVEGLSEQFAGLLHAIGILEPVVVVGHSFGGLVTALHGAQVPTAVKALLELDSSPDRSNPILDRQMQAVTWAARLAMVCVRLGIPDPLFSIAGKRLPAPAGARMMECSFGSIPSLRAGIAELKLLEPMRRAIEGGDGGVPHLIVSADRTSEVSGRLGRMLASPKQARQLVRLMQEQHRARMERCPRGFWETLPFNHGDLVFSDAGAKAASGRILAFLRDQC